MQPYAPRSFRFIELLPIGDWRMKLYGISCHGEFPRSELLSAAKKIAVEQLSSTTAAAPHLCLSIFGETRMNCSIVSFFLGTTILISWCRRNRRTRPFAFGTSICNLSSVRLGLNTCCVKLTRPISRDTLLKVCTKMPNF